MASLKILQDAGRKRIDTKTYFSTAVYATKNISQIKLDAFLKLQPTSPTAYRLNCDKLHQFRFVG